jgi:hypothetical protein
MHISKQTCLSTLEDSRKADGEATEQHITNMGCEVSQSWA